VNTHFQGTSDSEILEESLSIEVTTHCNSNCLHCFARAGALDHSSLSIELVKDIIAEGYNTDYRHLHITGGEPLLWDGLLDSLDFAFNMGYETILLNTNGTYLTKDVTRKLGNYPGLSISVSLEGTEALHDYLRGKGSYRPAVRGITNALDDCIDIFIFSTACKSLLPVLPHFADDIYKKFSGIKHLELIQLFSVPEAVFTLSEEFLEPEDFLKMVRIVSLLNLYGLKTCFLNNRLAYVISKLLRTPSIPQSNHLYRDGSMIVKVNRDICLSHSSKDSFGTYEFGMIEKVLHSNAYRQSIAPDDRTCPSCSYIELCRANGMFKPPEWLGNNHPESPYCKEVLDCIVSRTQRYLYGT
jgi:MoaA/NifB/PqqE/SkfB family radical SAM enzyme